MLNIKSFITVLKSPTIYQFAIVGAIGSLTTLAVTATLTSILGIFYAVSALIGLESSTPIVFFLNDRWTFSNVSKKTKAMQRFLKNNLVGLIGFGINETILISLTSVLGIHYLLSEGIAIIITFVFTFMASKKITWKN